MTYLPTLTLACLMSEIMETLDPETLSVSRSTDRPALSEVVDVLIGVPIAETTAALHVPATLTTDEALAARMRSALPERRHPVAPDIVGLPELRVTRARRMIVADDVGDNLILELSGPGVRSTCVLVYFERRGSTVVKDAFLLPRTLPAVVAELGRVSARQGRAPTFLDVALADARAGLEQGVTAYEAREHGLPPGDTWPGLKPLLRFLTTTMPTGGHWESTAVDLGSYRVRDDDELERASFELAHGFLGSTWGFSDASPYDHDLAHAFATASLLLDGDLRWTPAKVTETLEDVLPPNLSGDPAEYARVPELLSAFVRFCHDLAKIDATATRMALAAIHRSTGTFHALRAAPHVVQERAVIAPQDALLDLAAEISAWRTGNAVDLLGSPEALASLTAEALPDENLDVSGLPDDIIERVRRICEYADLIADEFYDVEFRTATRRLLGKIARTDPALFRGRSKDETEAGAILWIATRANEVLGSHAMPTTTTVQRTLGLGSSPAQRGIRLLAALGITHTAYQTLGLGDPALLTSAKRAEIIRWATPLM